MPQSRSRLVARLAQRSPTQKVPKTGGYESSPKAESPGARTGKDSLAASTTEGDTRLTPARLGGEFCAVKRAPEPATSGRPVWVARLSLRVKKNGESGVSWFRRGQLQRFVAKSLS